MNASPKSELQELLMARRRWAGDVHVEWVEDLRHCTVRTAIKGVMGAGSSRSWTRIEETSSTAFAQEHLPVPRLVDGYVVLGVHLYQDRSEKMWMAALARRARTGFRAMKVEYGFVATFCGSVGAGLTQPEAEASAQAAHRLAEASSLQRCVPAGAYSLRAQRARL